MASYELYSDKGGQFRFRLKAGNGQTILSSEGYTTKAAAKNGVASVGTNASRNGAFEMYTGKDGKHYFRLKASNGQVIGTSQGYAGPSGCKNGMASVQKNASAGIEDQTS